MGFGKGRNMICRNTALLTCLFALAACTSAPIYTVTDAPVVVRAGKQASADDVRDAILRAGRRLGWQMVPGERGVINAKLSLRTHVAVVDVRYSATSYSIVYRDSTNLDHSGDQIHKNYNGWIQNLDRDIRNELLYH
jgi:hypothetical protein